MRRATAWWRINFSGVGFRDGRRLGENRRPSSVCNLPLAGRPKNEEAMPMNWKANPR
jgi:hypothetical protein